VTRFGFVHRPKAVGDICREEEREVETTMTDVDLWRPDARFTPIHHAGQSLARPENVEMLVVAMQEAGARGRALVGDQRDGLPPNVRTRRVRRRRQLAAVEPRFKRFTMQAQCMDAREHVCHLPQPMFSIARHQAHVPSQARHEDSGTAECCVGDRADHARGGNVAAFELGENRCLQ